MCWYVCVCVCAQLLSHIQLSATPWIVAHQAPLSMGFSRQKHWNGLPFSSPGDLPNPGIEPPSLVSPALAGEVFTAVPLGNPVHVFSIRFFSLRSYYKLRKQASC